MGKCCKNCEFGEFKKTEKGNIRHSIPGRCLFVPEKPILPECLQAHSFYWPPRYCVVWPNDENTCGCFKGRN